ncbi:unnamed protein product [Porites evermanni]|uniref:Uncharacterized protein n=1 Tax=Porites evermanni TaxID=104178 RepID=A0ABN8LIF6_9CNID|nr:unnamed protein product [Porites evermanni]
MGIHDCVGDQGHMYMFGTPTRYPPSFIRISKKTEVEQDHQIVSYSDGCPGQNQNQTLFLFLAHVQRSGMYAINTW